MKMEKLTPLEAYKRSQQHKAEYEYLKVTDGMFLPPAFRIERNPPKRRLQQELRLLSKTDAFRNIVKYIRERFWIPLSHTFIVYSPDPEHDDLSDLTENLWIDLIERVRNVPTGIEIRVGGMDWSENYNDWSRLIGKKSEDLGEPQAGTFRLHIRWLLEDFGLPRQYGQTLEQYIIFGYADPIRAFEIHTDIHTGFYQSADGAVCIEIYPYTQASDIKSGWNEVEKAKKRLWGVNRVHLKIAPNLERDFEWYRLVTQEGKSPKEIADTELEVSEGEIDETIVRSAVNRIKRRLELNA